jgi:hypothetical protein
MGNVAIHKIEHCVKSILVGRSDAVMPMLPLALSWIDVALARGEVCGKNPFFYRAQMAHARGVALWLMNGCIDVGAWVLALESEEAAWSNGDRVWTRHEIVSQGSLDDYMAFSWFAGSDHWEAGVEMYEHWMRARAKVSVSGKLSPKKLLYAILLDATGRQAIPQHKLFAAGRVMLRANLQENWLGGGQAIRAATWLKIVHGLEGPSLTPMQTLLRAYDDMPDVTSPF